MNVIFKFELGQKVVLPNGEQGTVQSNSTVRGMTVKRVDVEWFGKTGERFSGWFDEDELHEVPEEDKGIE